MKATPHQTADTITQIEQLAARLRTLEPRVRHHAAGTDLDGYPTQGGPGGRYGHGDPVGALVAMRLDHPHRDVLGHAHRTMITKLDQARRLLEEAESTGRQALPPPTTRQRLDDGCISCARIKVWSPISRTRRCRWCSSWAGAHQGDDPPIPILRAHADGKRITTRLVETIRRRR